jgi:effector-binding domain-containing protein
MLKIGDFSKLSRVSVKTLRYYDDIGLLKPNHTDKYSGYRYYDYDQLSKLNRILALKDLGLSLDEVGQLVNEGLPAAQLRGMLRLKRLELQKQVNDDISRLERVEARLRQIEMEDKMPDFEVVIKTIERQLVASVRDTIPRYPEQGHLWQTLESFLAENKITPTGPCLTIYHSEEPDIDAEVCEPISTAGPPSERVRSHELPAVESMACLVFNGPFVSIGEAYEVMLKWIEGNGYQICGPTREVYLRPAENGSQTDSATVTEIQFPVRLP